jgi:hypothetical protein
MLQSLNATVCFGKGSYYSMFTILLIAAIFFCHLELLANSHGDVITGVRP